MPQQYGQALGVVLTGGLGTRLAPLTPETPKSLVPLLNRPLVAYALDLLAGLGLQDLVVVVGGSDARTGPAAIEAAPPGTHVEIAVQETPKGPGDALASVGAALDGRRVVVVAVDTVLHGGDLKSQLMAFESSDAVAWLPLHPTDRPHEMGIAELEGERIVSLEEKPQAPRSDLACLGIWMLAPEAVERVRTNPVINAKGESDLTGTIGVMLAEGHPVGGRGYEGRWLDCGSLSGLIEAQCALLDGAELPTQTDATIDATQLTGAVLLGSGARVTQCMLGPGVVVGPGAQLRGVTMQRALVAPGARLEGGDYRDVVITAAGEIGSAV